MSDWEDHGDLSTQEQPRRVLQKLYKSDRPETGAYEELTLRGGYDDLLARIDQEVNSGRDSGYNVTATLTREEGGLAELRVHLAELNNKDDDDDDDEDTQPEDEVMTRERPQWTFQISYSLEPLLTHPKYIKQVNNLSYKEKMCLRALMDEGSLDAEVSLPGEKRDKLSRFLGKYASSELVKKLLQGQKNYYGFLCQAEKVWRSKSKPGEAQGAEIVNQLSGRGAPRTPKGRNWLRFGPSYSYDGERYVVTETYLLSGADAWDKDMYESTNK